MAETSDNNLLSMAQQFSGLPMQSLIGGPLQAAAQAQQSLAMTQTQAILETGFIRLVDRNGKLTGYKPLTAAIELASSRPGPAGQAASALTLKLPVLTLMHIPSLAIRSVDIAFDMEVKSSCSRETAEQSASKLDAGAAWDARAGWGAFGVELKGSVSYDASHSRDDKQGASKSNDARYHVEVKAEQQPVPEGLKLLLQAFGKHMDMALAPPDAPAVPPPASANS
ncbi:DUF2589 domain-containing protein [Chromobacterium violaceum]|uniref:DUF2589 domain-containing protein n=1 Tax=Chromobacterium violaceum TaxID=536 RepID=UPI00143DDBDE|nr:DUF2589 domain-containing protein [Chromobacterium violaceum]QIY78863.1 DUF2589 domain-containing protein [Chromobacterium violaceum]